jgi:hypothetical protein
VEVLQHLLITVLIVFPSADFGPHDKEAHRLLYYIAVTFNALVVGVIEVFILIKDPQLLHHPLQDLPLLAYPARQAFEMLYV